MKKIAKIFSFVVLMGALIGAGWLVKKNQETRRGATALLVDPIYSIAQTTMNIGDTFTATFAVDTKDSANKLDGFDITVLFDKSKLIVDGGTEVVTMVSSGYSDSSLYFKSNVDPLLKTVDNTKGEIRVTDATVNGTANGIVYLFRVRFKAIAQGSALIEVSSETKGSNKSEAVIQNGDQVQEAMLDSSKNTSVTINQGGADTCTDSDNGKDYLHKGTVCMGSNNCDTDRCNAAGALIEGYCTEAGQVASETVDCTTVYGQNSICSDGICAPKPSITPSVTPTPTETLTPTPTETTAPSGNNPVLNFKMSFYGVSTGTCATSWPLQLIVMGNGVTKVYSNVVPVRDGSFVTVKDIKTAVYKGTVELTGFSGTSKLAVFIKGPKHLQTKYGMNDQTGFYNKAGGEIDLTKDVNTSPVYDWSHYPLLAGDITGSSEGVPDGQIDGRDYSYLKAKVMERATGDNLPADLNGDCVVNTMDSVGLMKALEERQSQLY